METNKGLIYTSENCIGCNKCLKGCPVMGSNIAVSGKDGSRIIVDGTKCVHCGKCLKTCEHNARHFRDDLPLLLDALSHGESIDLLVAPSFFLIYETKAPQYIGFLKSLGFENVYDVSNGANLTTWAYVKYYQESGRTGLISSTCPVIVDYIEKYKPELIDYLVPVQSPVQCLKSFLQYTENNPRKKYAFLCPCIGKHDELSSFDGGEPMDYTVTFTSLVKYISNNNINPDNFYGECTHIKSPGLAAFYPIPGGLRNNLRLFSDEEMFVKVIEGPDNVYPYLDQYLEKIKHGDPLPYFVDALNCKGGCAEGVASQDGFSNVDDLNMELLKNRKASKLMYPGSPFDASLSPKERLNKFDKIMEGFKLKPELFNRTYDKTTSYNETEVTPAIIESVFQRLHKNTFESRNINCTSCGYSSCRNMAIAISHGYNKPENCVHYMKETLEKEQKELTDLLSQIYRTTGNVESDRSSEAIVQNISTAFSEIEEEREKLFNESQAKSHFFASMTHELRTPLNAILNMADAVREDLPKGASTENIDSIKSAGNNLLETINELLDMSKLDSGKFKIVTDKYALLPLINDVGNVIRFRAIEKKLNFAMLTDPSLPSELIGDGKRIRQILINLLGNAVKYTPKGDVTLRTTWNNDSKNPVLSFNVIDTGMGIREEDIPYLFTAYAQVDEAKNHNIEGTGLGLSISDALAKEMNGSIDVTSVYGSGSTFTLTLPQEIEKYVPISELQKDSSSGAVSDASVVVMPRASILIVDDMTVNQRITSAFLEELQAKITLASSGQEALELCEKEYFDVILMDYQMPMLSGLETLQRIRISDIPSKNSPVIMLTAEETLDFDETGSSAFQGYLTKPVNKVELKKSISKIIDPSRIIEIKDDTLPQKGFFTQSAEADNYDAYLIGACTMERISKAKSETQICHLTRSHRIAIQEERFDFAKRNARFLDAQLELLRGLVE